MYVATTNLTSCNMSLTVIVFHHLHLGLWLCRDVTLLDLRVSIPGASDISNDALKLSSQLLLQKQ